MEISQISVERAQHQISSMFGLRVFSAARAPTVYAVSEQGLIASRPLRKMMGNPHHRQGVELAVIQQTSTQLIAALA